MCCQNQGRLVGLAATIAREIPLLILGCLGIFGGCLSLFLPESMGKDMPQTILDGENYGLGQKFWDFPCWNRAFASSNFLEAESNFQKPKLERNNVVNKGVWVRNKFKENLFEKGRVGDFIFRENSLDVDNLLQNNFDAFGANYMQDSPLVSAYVERTKRAARVVREQRPRKSIIKTCTGRNCKTKPINLDNELGTVDVVKSKILNKLRPTSVFNDYPYEVAILLNNNKSELDLTKNDTSVYQSDDANAIVNQTGDKIADAPFPIENENKDNNTENKNTLSPKRSMKYDFETEIIKKFEITEDLNRTEQENQELNASAKVNDRNIFDKDNTVWHQNAPIPDINVYKVVPKEPQKSKPVTERGLIKVISMLTKTFKKIIRQHHEIKDIHNRINEINDEFGKNAATINNKFQDFDVKYLYLLKFHEKLKVFDAKMAAKEEFFKTKEIEMARNFKEFENQQKKFLQQQRQFYNIQKLMLAQNEKINMKQNLIAKTQSEISHRQNNFARILKKAKQLYIDSRNPSITKLSSSLSKLSKNPPIKVEPKLTTSNSLPTTTTESVKINLFSIPTSNKIENQDDLIIKEKDEQTIDDLVYKYYFNNTFIDNLMKNNVLNSFMAPAENTGHSRNVKSKRNELETTILLPVFDSNDSELLVSKNRERRWINHHSKHKSKRRDRGKGAVAAIVNATDDKHSKKQTNNVPVDKDAPKDIKMKNDPFLTMATNFCTEIKQNLNAQRLKWCVEKALRKLQVLDTKNVPNSPSLEIPMTTAPPKPINIPLNTNLNVVGTQYTGLSTIPSSGMVGTSPTVASGQLAETTGSSSTMQTPSPATKAEGITTFAPPPSTVKTFFPGNEELESNLKQFDLKPDIEGNFYYEGSVHASEIFDSESQGIDDIIPGLESNSRVDMDPLAFDLQAKRRAFVRKCVSTRVSISSIINSVSKFWRSISLDTCTRSRVRASTGHNKASLVSRLARNTRE
ncbi:unnamed protein product [Chrysodeixis includens]|uniref:Uncharacterized protein n=1 Tax=Chrysodeixis includens TaxID=689277 RepID=A0A9N8L873_CHRIL|nr:unnamed protein product [Chrysodeixis includens]